MNVLYLGKFCEPAEFEARRPSRTPSYVAQYSFERALVEEWGRMAGFTISVLSLVQSRSFPSEPLVFRRRSADQGGLRYLPYINLPYLREICLFFGTLVAIVRWVLKAPHPRAVFLATHFAPTTAAAIIAGKAFGVPVLLTLTDLTSFSYSTRRLRAMPPLRAFFALGYRRVSGWFETAADGYIMFASGMRAALGLGGARCLVMEGMLDPSQFGSIPVPADRRRAIAHAGTLDAIYGIRTVLSVFEGIEDPDLELWLIGSGDMDEEIADRANLDSRIRQFGLLPRGQVLNLLSQASLLVNFRDSAHEYTALSFPSKILEYMASGTPVLCTRLAGIPAEYWEHMYAAESSDPVFLTQAVREILEIPQESRERRGQDAREFILREKSPAAQVARIAGFVAGFKG